MFALYPPQQAALDAIEAGWKEYSRLLVSMPTGLGKTVLFSHVALGEVSRGHRVMILAHREELLEQAQDKLRLAADLDSGLERGSSTAHDSFWPTIVASVDSLHANRLERWDPASIDLIIIDEAHHALANKYRRVIDHFNRSRLLGVTATPDRGDKKSLGAVFENIAYEYSMRDAVNDGYLCRLKSLMVPLEIDLSGVEVKKGFDGTRDYSDEGLDEAISPYLAAAAAAIKEYASDRKTLAFLPLVRTSKAFAEVCRSIGLRAQHVDGQSKDRAEILAAYADDEYQVLSNSSLLLEGYDCPAISCLACLRPTQSRPLYQQMIGRGTRLAPGKTDLLILDFLWQTQQHDLCVPASLYSKDAAFAAEATAMARRMGAEAVDLLDIEDDVKAERERKLAERFRQHQGKQVRVIDPLEFGLALGDEELEDYQPVSRWEFGQPSDKQLSLLGKWGIDVSKITSKGHASKLIDRVLSRRNANLCTPKQATLLRRYGIDAASVSFDRAKQLIDELLRGAA